MKERFLKLLNSVQREGIKELAEHLESAGFFTAPCSTSHHLSKEGGLLEHSLNVLDCAIKLNNELGAGFDLDTLTIVALLHDVGKMGDHGKANYVPKMVKSKKKDENGNYPLVQSEATPFETNKNLLYIPHEIRSLIIVEKYIRLTEQEEHAILYHNGLYGELKYSISGKETSLYMILHFADMWASRVVESEDNNEI